MSGLPLSDRTGNGREVVAPIAAVRLTSRAGGSRLLMSSMTARGGAGSSEVPGRTLSSRLHTWVGLFQGAQWMFGIDAVSDEALVDLARALRAYSSSS